MALGPRRRDAKIATYRDLGSFQLLLSLQDDEALKLFCDSILGPIEHSEGYYGGELMRSLRPSSRRTGGCGAAAERLCSIATRCATGSAASRNSPAGPGLGRDRIEFWLALRGRELTS